ncbi:beta-ketoacyl-[acyl-carrier-protein] synthase II [candidate division KSB3 bacterium]|uniref:3-oxoacyl-[acyl-carrier-protein] synthase 2 n=1 Tax=candidate division KSB3 bacterium TaxID=2044937 RepID=A0A2G6E7I2_9BACT|nr:MAG: beta-ketoacyl-[acyl-carrier-protein] synthase II [candidate division KSB3 bacterium]PIE30229.1 MAG: beta-ketoacyl-[acyl-carrier-protein] synthase II [candidate division KSB3 bacterium]
MKKRVVITGMGTVNAIGNNVETFWKNAQAGISGTDTITRFDPSALSSRVAAELKDFDATDFIDKKEAKRMDPFVHYAIASADMAIADSELDLDKINQQRMGVALGSGMGGMQTFETQHKVFLERGPGRVSPFFIPMEIINMASGHLSIRYGLRGANFAVATACATGSHAIGEALRWIQRGEMDLMLAGGSEATVTALAIAGFGNMKALSTHNDEPARASRPFDKTRNGFVIGEGSAVFVLESLDHALARNAEIYAELIGYSTTGDGYHITSPDPEAKGVTTCMKNAIADAEIVPEDVSYINAHGTSTPFNDKFETKAVKQVFNGHSKKLAISSTKSMIGHCLGAAGAIELIATVMAVKNDIVPPTINYENPDPDCDLDYVPNNARSMTVDVAMSNSFGFGGTNATLVVKKYSEN